MTYLDDELAQINISLKATLLYKLTSQYIIEALRNEHMFYS